MVLLASSDSENHSLNLLKDWVYPTICWSGCLMTAQFLNMVVMETFHSLQSRVL